MYIYSYVYIYVCPCYFSGSARRWRGSCQRRATGMSDTLAKARKSYLLAPILSTASWRYSFSHLDNKAHGVGAGSVWSRASMKSDREHFVPLSDFARRWRNFRQRSIPSFSSSTLLIR